MKRFAEEIIKPLVRQMDDNSTMDDRVMRGTFDNGFMGVEVPPEYDGPGATFFDIIIIVEELAKVSSHIRLLSMAKPYLSVRAYVCLLVRQL